MNEWIKVFDSTNRNIFHQCIANRRLIEIIIQGTPAKGRILEAGCGTALLSLILADYGFDVTALDFTEEIVSYAKKRVCLNNVDLTFLQGDILNLSVLFEDRYFDTICHSGVMEHFNDNDIIRSLAEQKRVTKKVIFSIPNNRNTLTPHHFGDERFLSNSNWMRLIKEAGFKKVNVYGGYDLPKFTYFIFPGVFFHKKASLWWKWFSKHSIFVCE